MSSMKAKNEEKKGLNMYGNLAHNIYAQNNVGVESPAKLIEMLYEGILRFNAQARKAIRDGDVEKRVYWLNRSISIISELISVLDKSQGDIAIYLDGLYNQEIKNLTEVNITLDLSKLDEVDNVFRVLLETWREETGVA